MRPPAFEYQTKKLWDRLFAGANFRDYLNDERIKILRGMHQALSRHASSCKPSRKMYFRMQRNDILISADFALAANRARPIKMEEFDP